MHHRNSKLIYQHQLWQVLERRLSNLQVVFSLIQTTLSEVSSQVTWQSEDMSLNVLESESTQEEYEALVRKSEVVKYNILELSLSLKNLSQQLDAVHKTVSEEAVRQSTFLYGTKKSKTSLFSRITKGLKTIVSGN